MKTKAIDNKKSSQPEVKNPEVQNTGPATTLDMNSGLAKICPCEGSCPRCSSLQTKIKSGSSNDYHEKEQLSRYVPAYPNSSGTDKQPRQGSFQAVPMGKENNNAFYNALRGTGMALTEKEREQFEPRFGTDFKNVRLHNSLRAYKLADQIHARAFTYKNNIVFNRGEYNTTSYAGQKLLAHELTHVIQQTNAANIMPEKISSVAGNQQVIQREFDRTRLQTYLNETYNSSVIESRREYAITQLLDHKNDVLSACRQHGVDKPSFPAAVIWQELYFRGADLTSGAQDVWSVFGPLGGGNWSLGLAQVRPSTAAQVIGDIPFRPRSEMATTQEEYEELPWNLRAAYRALLAYDVNYNVYIAVGYLKLLKERRYGTSSWTSLSEPQLELIASEYSHGPYPMRHTTPNHNGRQAMTIWWGGWFGTSCVQAEF